MKLLLCCAALLFLLNGSPAAENWPQWRGPDGTGVADGAHLPDRWSATRGVIWKRDLPGRGWSSPIVWGGRVFLTTCVNSEPGEEPKKGLYFGGNRPEPPKSVHQWRVFCLDLATGRVKWNKLVHKGVPTSAIHLKNSFASETPVTDGERVYCYFGNLGVFCFTLDGEPVWEVKFPPHATRFGWGTAASPVLHEGRLYVVNDNDEDSYLVALDARSGEEIWRVARDEKSNWATPFIWQNSLRTEIVTPGTGKVRSYDLEGKLLYEFGGMSSIAIPTPVVAGERLLVSSGYILDKVRPMYALRPGAEGDISLEPGETSNDFIAWCQTEAGPYNPSPLVYGKYTYVLLDRGFLTCYDAETGDEVYGRQRIPEGGAFTSSPWAYDGKVFCLNEDGVTTVVEAGPEFKVVGTNALADDDMCMATPAMVDGKLLLRTSARVYCLGDR